MSDEELVEAVEDGDHLEEIPPGTTSHLIEAAGLALGLLFGLASLPLIQVRRDLVTVAGWPYAALWTLAMGLRRAFAYGSTHWFTESLATFSADHRVPRRPTGPRSSSWSSP